MTRTNSDSVLPYGKPESFAIYQARTLSQQYQVRLLIFAAAGLFTILSTSLALSCLAVAASSSPIAGTTVAYLLGYGTGPMLLVGFSESDTWGKDSQWLVV